MPSLQVKDSTSPPAISSMPSVFSIARYKSLLQEVWLWPTVIVLAVGFYKLTVPELWIDELATWSASTRSVVDLVELMRNMDAVIGPYYLFMHGWINVFGDSQLSLRLPSLLTMAAASGGIASIGKRLVDARAGLFAGLIFAVVPSVSRYAQEARPYAITVFGVVLATLLLLRALETSTWFRWGWYAVSIGVVGLSNLLALTILLPHLLFVALRWWPRRADNLIVRFFLAATVGVLPVLPFIRWGWRQAPSQVGTWWQSPGLQDVLDMGPQLFASGLVAVALLAIAVVGIVIYRNKVGLALAWAVLPPAVLWLVSQGDTSFWKPRYLLFTLPAWAILAGAGLAAVKLRGVAIVGLAAVAVMGIPDQRALREPGSHFAFLYPTVTEPAVPPNYAAAARIVEEHQQVGDGIVYGERKQFWLMDIALQYYLRHGIQPRDVFVDETAIQRGNLRATECSNPASCLKGEQRIWLWRLWDQPDPFEGMDVDQAAILRENFDVTQVWHERSITVALLTRR